MALNSTISLGLKLEELGKSIEDMGPEVEATLHDAIGALAQSAYAESVRLANERLKSSRQDYVQSLNLENLGGDIYVLSLTGDAANATEDGYSGFDMKCLNGSTKIKTLEHGDIQIRKANVGDRVLSHNGKWRKILAKQKRLIEVGEMVVTISLGNPNADTFRCSGDHPILTDSGWKLAKNLCDKDRVVVLAKKCENCDKLTRYKNRFCSRFCCRSAINKKKSKDGTYWSKSRIGREHLSKTAAKTNARLLKEGRHVSQTYGREFYASMGKKGAETLFSDPIKAQRFQEAAAKKIGKSHLGFSGPEFKFDEILRSIGFKVNFYSEASGETDFIKQYRVKVFENKVTTGNYRWIDYYNSKLNIAIEVDGEQYHKNTIDDENRWNLIKSCFPIEPTLLRIASKDIYKSKESVKERVELLVNNHSDSIDFCEQKIFSVKKDFFAPISRKYTDEKPTVLNNQGFTDWYDIQVEEDQSFTLSNGVVVHNSGLLNGPNSKVTAKGTRFNTVPFYYQPTSNAPASQKILDLRDAVRSLVKERKLDQIFRGESGEPLQGIVARVRNTGITNLEGLVKVQKQYEKKTQSYYMTFRRVSSNSDPGKWLHPGYGGAKIFPDVERFIDSELDRILEAIL